MSIRHAVQQDNPFLTAPIGRLFLSNAPPMAVVMSMGGILNVVDGIFVGHFIGPEAQAAVGLAFPVTMALSALATLVGGGMSSLLARQLGAGDRTSAGQVFAGAHGLALVVAVGMVALWLACGPMLMAGLAAGNERVAALAGEYLAIIVLGAPLQLALSLQADALRNEGGAGLIAALSVLVNLCNIAANWMGIVVFDFGIAGSALGTVVTQALGLALLVGVRARSKTLLPLSVLRFESWGRGWGAIFRLGLPLCLSFFGIAVVASTVILALRLHGGVDHDRLVAGYGVVTRLLSLAFLPQLAIALATQSITGNNAGAGRQDRAHAALRLALGVAFLWCLTVALGGFLAGVKLGGWFSTDPAIARAVAQILGPISVFYAVSGPILVLALHFQALGQPKRTALLTLVKPWLLSPALLLTLSQAFGPRGIWMAFPVGDAMILALLVARGALSQVAPARELEQPA